jgi:chemotaxis signal transduction protein
MDAEERERRGGLLLRVEGELRFLAASVAVRVAPLPPVEAVPGAPPDLLGIALHEGVVVSVIAIGPRRDANGQNTMIVCQHAGELVALVGAEVVEAGTFDEQGAAQPLDLAAIYARASQNSRSFAT